MIFLKIYLRERIHWILGLQLRNSNKSVQELLSERTKRLLLNEKNFKIYTPASLISINECLKYFSKNDLQKFVIVYFNYLFNI